MFAELFDDISPELREKAKGCETADELVALAEDEGVKLSEEQIEAIAGGGSIWSCNKNEGNPSGT